MLKRPAASDGAFRRKVAEAEKLPAQSIEKVHEFARELRPAILDQLGIQSALRAHLADFTRRTAIRTELISHPTLAWIDGTRGEVIFRVVQEALNNVFKHARATAVKIQFSALDGTLGMVIADNGRAFCPEKKIGAGAGGRLGLLGMRERVRLVKGIFAIESAPGRGTRIRVQIPFGSRPGETDPAATSDRNGRLRDPELVEDNFHEKNIRTAR
jgi:two-component system sensor histidine kinase DegS